ncbi:dual oxidase maturation factor 1-like isoform X2 [Lineus longissimus]
MSPIKPTNIPGWFQAFRDGDWSAYYGPIRTAATVDFRQVCVLYSWSLMGLGCSVLIIGTRRSERFSTLLRMSMALHVGFAVLLSMISSDWLVARGHVTSWYGLTNDQKIDADVSIHVGLDHVNISLIGKLNSSGDVYYNERISWWGVHQAEKEYDAALSKGLPIPLMDMEETFGIGFDQFDINKSIDLRTAGYYTYILLCTGLSFWFVTNVLVYLVITEAALLFILTGFVLLLANLVYYFGQPREPVVIHVEGTKLELTFGWCFFVNLVAGGLTFLAGIVLCIAGRLAPARVAMFFDITNDNVMMELKASKGGKEEHYQTYQEPEPCGLANATFIDDDEDDGGDDETAVDAVESADATRRVRIELDPFRKISY